MPPLLLDSPHPVSDLVRLVMVVAGILIFGVCARVGWQALLRRDWEYASAVLSFALLVLAPPAGSILAFGRPLPVLYGGIYLAALVAAILALCFRVRIRAPWRHRPGRGADRG